MLRHSTGYNREVHRAGTRSVQGVPEGLEPASPAPAKNHAADRRAATRTDCSEQFYTDATRPSGQAELVRQSLARLSPEHGEVIDLVYYHGKSVREVAEIVGVAEATVKTRMFYARKKLAELLEAA